MKRTHFQFCQNNPYAGKSMARVVSLPLFILLLLGAGCSSSRYSVEPRTVIRIDRSKTETTSAVRHTNGVSNEPADLGVAPTVNPVTGTATVPETNSATGVNAPSSQLAPGTVGVGLPLNSIATPQSPGISGATPSPSLPNVGDAVSARPASSGAVGGAQTITGAGSGLAVTPAPVTAAPGAQNFGASTRPSSTGSPTATSAVNAAPTAITGTASGLNNNTGGTLGSGLSGTGAGIGNSLTNNVFTATNLFGPRP